MNPHVDRLDDPERIRKLVELQVDHERAEYAAPAPEHDAPLFTLEEIMKALNSNEDGDAGLFIEVYRGRFCYDHAAGRWYKWTGNYWQEDLVGEATEGINAVIDLYDKAAERQAWQRRQAVNTQNQEAAKKHADHENQLLKRIRALQTVHRKQNVLQLARTGAASLGITGNEWDSGPWLLGCMNGVIDLKTGQHRPGQPEDFIKTIAPHDWRGIDEAAPLWETFLNQIFDGDQELITYIQRLFGYGITGLTTQHIYPIFWGKGRNGKGTLLETLKYVLGSLAFKTKAETLLDQKFNRPSGAPDADTLAMRGKRLVWASEINEGRRINAGRLKELVGGDTLNARAPFGIRPVEFRPTHLLILLTNDRPQANPNDYALWQRIHLIPFTFSFIDDPKEPNERKADPELPEKLKQEAPGILAWLVSGCLAWQQEGLKPPVTIITATKEYRQTEDIIGQFISERCITGPNLKIKAGDLFKVYEEFCEERGLEAKKRAFSNEIKNRFDYATDRNLFYIGINLMQ